MKKNVEGLYDVYGDLCGTMFGLHAFELTCLVAEYRKCESVYFDSCGSDIKDTDFCKSKDWRLLTD